MDTPVPVPHMNICKGPPSLENAWKPEAVSSVASDNASSEYNNDILIETEESNDGSVKPSSHLGMWGMMQMLFIFGVDYMY